MKNWKLPGLLMVLFLASCEKSDPSSDLWEGGLQGKWHYTEYYYSIGGPGEWHPVPQANQFIEFNDNGVFKSTEYFLPQATRYSFVDSATIKLEPANTTSGYILMGFTINKAEQELVLYPVDPMCIEGCSNKFKRMSQGTK